MAFGEPDRARSRPQHAQRANTHTQHAARAQRPVQAHTGPSPHAARAPGRHEKPTHPSRRRLAAVQIGSGADTAELAALSPRLEARLQVHAGRHLWRRACQTCTVTYKQRQVGASVLRRACGHPVRLSRGGGGVIGAARAHAPGPDRARLESERGSLLTRRCTRARGRAASAGASARGRTRRCCAARGSATGST